MQAWPWRGDTCAIECGSIPTDTLGGNHYCEGRNRSPCGSASSLNGLCGACEAGFAVGGAQNGLIQDASDVLCLCLCMCLCPVPLPAEIFCMHAISFVRSSLHAHSGTGPSLQATMAGGWGCVHEHAEWARERQPPVHKGAQYGG
jgi:hypothetical protein